MSDLQCSLCCKTFTKADSLKKHKSRTHWNEPPAMFSCFYCDFKTPHQYNLNKHMEKIHLTEVITSVKQKTITQQCVSGDMDRKGQKMSLAANSCSLIRNSSVSAYKMPNLRCSLCGKTFARAGSLRKHMSCSHREKPETYSCFYCDFKTAYKYYLNQHMNKIHITKDGTVVEQNACSLQFGSEDSTVCKGAISSAANSCVIPNSPVSVERRPDQQCSLCGKAFAKADSLRKHKSRSHREKPPGTFSCFYCDFKTIYKYNLNKHMNKIHISKDGNLVEQITSSQPLKVCGLCNSFQCTNRNKMINHYIDAHDVPIFEEVLYFNSFDAFIRWKLETESQEYCRFVAASAKRKRLTKHVWYFRCFIDGHYVPKGKGIRSLKVRGSVKMGSVCPCSLKVTETLENGSVTVLYVKPHVGHKPDVSRLTLTREDRGYLASRISAGMTEEQLLSSLRDSMCYSKPKRLHLTTRKELWNIKHSALIKNEADEQWKTAKQLETDDHLGVDEQVVEYEVPEDYDQPEIGDQGKEDEQIEVGEQSEVDERTKYEDMKQALISSFCNLIDSTKNCAQLELIRNAFLPLPNAIRSLETKPASPADTNRYCDSSTSSNLKNLQNSEQNNLAMNCVNPEISVRHQGRTGFTLPEVISKPLFAEDVHQSNRGNGLQVFYG